ncbi:MAG TPA: type 1 glutamine amidotransferase [Actinomycetota bacterium]|nr:type 1 glutamine amidotransferase [Actinomycetota bacterium]
MKPLLCVRHQATCPLGVLGEEFDARGMPWHYLDAWKEDSVPDLSDVSGLVVLGGEMNVDEMDSYPFLKTVRDLTRDAVEAGMPVLGVCLGAQVMARALGAEVTRSPIKEIGFVEVSATDAGSADPVLGGFAPSSKVFQFHEDMCGLPEGADLLFEGDTVAVQAFRVGERAYGVQFHLEVTMTEVENWCIDTPNLEQDWGVSKEAVVAQAEQMLGQQQVRGRDVARRFVETL